MVKGGERQYAAASASTTEPVPAVHRTCRAPIPRGKSVHEPKALDHHVARHVPSPFGAFASPAVESKKRFATVPIRVRAPQRRKEIQCRTRRSSARTATYHHAGAAVLVMPAHPPVTAVWKICCESSGGGTRSR